MVFPKQVETNGDLMNKAEAEDFKNKTGIYLRKIEYSLDNSILGYMHQGCRELIQNLNWDTESIQALICITQTPDRAYPSLSNRLHGQLGLSTSCLCFDVNLGCSGYVYGLHLVYSLLQSLQSQNANALLCVGDISSRFIPKVNTGLRSLFSDGISVTAIEKSQNESPSWFNLESFGKGAMAIHTQVKDSRETMEMDGLEVYKYSVQHVPNHIKQLLHFSSNEINHLDALVCHQANKIINESIRRAVGMPQEKTLYSLNLYGNMSSASIPATLVAHKNELSNNAKLLICGFGVGFSIASAIINLHSSAILGQSEFHED